MEDRQGRGMPFESEGVDRKQKLRLEIGELLREGK